MKFMSVDSGMFSESLATFVKEGRGAMLSPHMTVVEKLVTAIAAQEGVSAANLDPVKVKAMGDSMGVLVRTIDCSCEKDDDISLMWLAVSLCAAEKNDPALGEVSELYRVFAEKMEELVAVYGNEAKMNLSEARGILTKCKK
ncbi:MAG: hypothetical protein ACRC92_18755 [Peptostreptococcaceae bacterium]